MKVISEPHTNEGKKKVSHAKATVDRFSGPPQELSLPSAATAVGGYADPLAYLQPSSFFRPSLLSHYESFSLSLLQFI